ncbi:hypothetical protein F511_38029 [Dorcoceras hygrometricum]|uniref:Uncharacterized protein n=1 Tax=Dorcoceras hygrometricum TaxID=472368 RepID=A0A2Z7B4A2_9LAMI|nr:hypothetical protein F511_38029 [Dorcoceras hygrometricum]
MVVGRIIVIPVGARHKCQRAGGWIRIPNKRLPGSCICTSYLVSQLKSEPVHSNTYRQNSTQVPYTHAGINYKNRAQINKICLPRSLQQQRNYRLHGKKTQQLRTSSPPVIQSLKWVAIERAKQGEFSATKIVQNKGWKRWESNGEMFE